MDRETLHQLFDVDVERGILTWKTAPRTHPRLRGAVAGSKVCCSSKYEKFYWVVKIDGKSYKRGRLIFLAAHGRWPLPCVDHENGNSLDDRLKNLREATFMENCRNIKCRKKRSSLPMGVRRQLDGRYQARIGVNKQLLHLGSFDTPEAAQAAYLTKRKEFFGDFA